MKSIICLAVFLSVAFGARVCFPEIFKTDQVTFDPAQNDVFGSRLWFDYPAEKMRLDIDVIIVDNNLTHNRVSFILDYNKQLMYHIFYSQGSANCTIRPLTQPLETPCLSKKAQHRGTIELGGVLATENYVEFDEKDGHKVHADILFIENINVPVRIARRHPDGRMTIDEFWNFDLKVHHDAFVIPSVCQNGNVESEIHASALGVMKRLEPSLEVQALFFGH